MHQAICLTTNNTNIKMATATTAPTPPRVVVKVNIDPDTSARTYDYENIWADRLQMEAAYRRRGLEPPEWTQGDSERSELIVHDISDASDAVRAAQTASVVVESPPLDLGSSDSESSDEDTEDEEKRKRKEPSIVPKFMEFTRNPDDKSVPSRKLKKYRGKKAACGTISRFLGEADVDDSKRISEEHMSQFGLIGFKRMSPIDRRTCLYSSLGSNRPVGWLPDNLTRLLGPSARRHRAIGNGTCFFYSVLRASQNAGYEKLSGTQQSSAGVNFRTSIADWLTLERYQIIFGTSEIPGVDEAGLETLKDEIGQKTVYGNYANVGSRVWQVMMRYRNINVIVFNIPRATFACDQLPQDPARARQNLPPGPGESLESISENPFEVNRPTVLVAHVDEMHYEPIFFRRSDGSRVWSLPPGDALVAFLRQRYPIECTSAAAAYFPGIGFDLEMCLGRGKLSKITCNKMRKTQIEDLIKGCRMKRAMYLVSRKNLRKADLCNWYNSAIDRINANVAELSASLHITPAGVRMLMQSAAGPNKLGALNIILRSDAAYRAKLEKMDAFVDGTGAGYDLEIARLRRELMHIDVGMSEIDDMMRALRAKLGKKRTMAELESIILEPISAAKLERIQVATRKRLKMMQQAGMVKDAEKEYRRMIAQAGVQAFRETHLVRKRKREDSDSGSGSDSYSKEEDVIMTPPSSSSSSEEDPFGDMSVGDRKTIMDSFQKNPEYAEMASDIRAMSLTLREGIAKLLSAGIGLADINAYLFQWDGMDEDAKNAMMDSLYIQALSQATA